MPTRRVRGTAYAAADDTRLAVLRALLDAGGPLAVAELAERFGLHANGLRRHLRALVAAGLAVESAEHTGQRGRPRLRWTVAEPVTIAWTGQRPYERLAAMLAEIQASGTDPEEVGRRFGWARVTAATGAAAVVEVMAAEGFDPAVEDSGDVVLRTCPYGSVADAYAATVCSLHLGLARGAAQRGGGGEVVGLDAHDPRAGRCVLRLRQV